ncbi:MAG: hypothetical protein CR959_01425, partial [Fusobacteriales bacterium]
TVGGNKTEAVTGTSTETVTEEKVENYNKTLTTNVTGDSKEIITDGNIIKEVAGGAKLTMEADKSTFQKDLYVGADAVATNNLQLADKDAIQIGKEGNEAAEGGKNVAIGYGNKVNGTGNTALGSGNVMAASSSDNQVIGNNIVVEDGVTNSIALGNGSVVSTSNTVSVGKAGAERKIVNVADGDVRHDSMEAVNGRQLYYEDQKINTVAALGAAMAAADLTNVPVGKLGIAAGVGNFLNKRAIAVGVGYAPSQDLRVNAKWAVSPDAKIKYNTLSVGATYFIDLH